jgi:hypothetical protein
VLEDRTVPSVFQVTTAADNGDNANPIAGSLRDAISQVNAGLYNEIDFAIPTSDAGYQSSTTSFKIQPLALLPAIMNPVVIDGTTQPQFVAAGHPVIELNGGLLGRSGTYGLKVICGSTTIQGLAINGFVAPGNSSSGIYVTDHEPNSPSGLGHNVISGNYLGTNVTGTALPPGPAMINGVRLDSSSNNTISENVIAGAMFGVGVVSVNSMSDPSHRNVIDDNKIGTDYTGQNVLGTNNSNSFFGIGLAQDNNETIRGNLIRGYFVGVIVGGESIINSPVYSVQVIDNTLTDNRASGVTIIGAHDIQVGAKVDDPNPALSGNIIAHNNAAGLLIWGGSTANHGHNPVNNTIRGNSIHDNGGLGIDLGIDQGGNNGGGVTLNDSAGHAGPNNYQNFPVLTSASSSGTSTFLSGTFSETAEPSTALTLDFYANPAADPSGYGQGQTYLGEATVTTDANGSATFTADLAVGNLAGQWITATATDPNGNTSEFSADVNVAPLPPSSLSGVVWEDFNNDGQVDFGEKGIDGVTITLTGTDFLGNAVNLPPQQTDSGGAYVFLNLLPGTYTLTETSPAGYLPGIDSVGTAGGIVVAPGQFSVPLAAGVNGLNYNFGELPPASGSVQPGQTAGIGFWNNKNGQALIKALPVVTNADGSVTSVANWLAATLPHIFGKNSANDLTGQSNAAVAALFQQDFVLKGVKLDAQVLATALSVYATNATLDPTQVAAQYGFTVSGDGAGTATVNVGSNGAAFGVANNTTLTLVDLLLATDEQAVNGVLYNGDALKRSEANAVYSAVNQAGGS